MIKVMTIIGTRPEAIKMAPVIKELEKHPDCIESIVCATAQHRGEKSNVNSCGSITWKTTTSCRR